MGIIILLLPLVLIFFMMQSQRKKAAAQTQLLKALTEGDDVMTTAGLYGTLTWVGQEEAFIEISEGVEIHVIKAAIAKKVDMTTTEAARASDGATDVGHDGDAPEPSADVATNDQLDDGLGIDDPTPPVVEPKRRRLGGAP